MNKAEERYIEIIEILKNNPIVTVAELAERLSVSPETIRKDLNYLAEQKEIVRIHGGAALASETAGSPPFSSRKTMRQREKRMLAEAACGLIEPGDSLIIESSTTMVELARVLLEQPELLKTLVIVTNSFHVAALFEMGRLCARMFFLGGWLNPEEQSAQGQFTSSQLKSFHVDKCLLSGAALGRNMQLSSYYEDDMMFQKQAMKCATQKILLVEAGKYPSSAILSVAPIGVFDSVVTNIDFDRDSMERLETSGTRLLYVNTGAEGGGSGAQAEE